MQKIFLGFLLLVLPVITFAKSLTTVDEMIRQLNSSQMTDSKSWKDSVSPNGVKVKVAKKDGNKFTLSDGFFEVVQSLALNNSDSETSAIKTHLICIMVSTAALGREMDAEEQKTVIQTVSTAAQVSPVGTFSIIDGFEIYSSITTSNNVPIVTCGIKKRLI